MNRLLKSILVTGKVALTAAVVSSCGILEPNVLPSSTATVTPLITSGAQVATASTASSVESSTVKVAGNSSGAVLPVTGAIQQIFQTDRCNELSRGGFIWFTDTVVLEDWLKSLSPPLIKDVKSQVNFATQGVLLLDYGPSATSGAGATVTSKALGRKGSEAFVTVKRFKSSATDKKRAQVVTHPCSLHVMPRSGFNKLVIQSELGDRLTSFANP